MKKKLLVCCALLISAVVASAIPWGADAYRQSTSLIKAGKLAEVRAYLDTIDNQRSTIPHRIWADYIDPAIDTTTSAKLYAIAEGYYSATDISSSSIWLKNASESTVLWVLLYGADKPEEALAYFNTLENPSGDCIGRAVDALQKLGRNDEALALAVANKRWYDAFSVAKGKKDKVKTFEYGKKLLLDAYQKPNIVKLVLDVIGGFNYDDTEIAIDDQILFLFNFDGKYSRFLVEERNLPEAEKVWEPIIAGVRVTVDRLQAKKALLNK